MDYLAMLIDVDRQHSQGKLRLYEPNCPKFSFFLLPFFAHLLLLPLIFFLSLRISSFFSLSPSHFTGFLPLYPSNTLFSPIRCIYPFIFSLCLYILPFPPFSYVFLHLMSLCRPFTHSHRFFSSGSWSLVSFFNACSSDR